MDGLSQTILVMKTSLPTPPRLIRGRRTLQSRGPESRISINSVGRLLTLISSTRVSSSSIWISPLVADEEPGTNLMTLWLPSLGLTVLSPIHPFLGIFGLPGSWWDISSSLSWSSGRVRSVTSSESAPEEAPWADRSSPTSSASLADGKPGSCDNHTAAPYVVVFASLKDGSPGLRACPSIWRLYNLPWSVVVVIKPATSIERHLTSICSPRNCILSSSPASMERVASVMLRAAEMVYSLNRSHSTLISSLFAKWQANMNSFSPALFQLSNPASFWSSRRFEHALSVRAS